MDTVNVKEVAEPAHVPNGVLEDCFLNMRTATCPCSQHDMVSAGSSGAEVERPAREVPPPADPELRKTIEAMAPFVARNGPAFEAFAVKANAKSQKFSFIVGGAGAEYYRWRVQVVILILTGRTFLLGLL